MDYKTVQPSVYFIHRSLHNHIGGNILTLNLLWYFIFYAFLGWCTEVVYAAVNTGRFINRGFLNGPYCPIYGFGVLFVISLLFPFKDNLLYMFVGSVLITSAIEFTGGYVLEKMFHQKWWDYSGKPFNIRGYICLQFSLVWGLACLVIVDRIHPFIEIIVKYIPVLASQIALTVFCCLLFIDTISTAKSILKLNKKLEVIDDISLKIREATDNLGEDLAVKTISIMQKKEELEESFETKKEVLQSELAEIKEAQQLALSHRKQALAELQKANREVLDAWAFGQKRLIKAFPGLISIDHKDALEKLRTAILKIQTDDQADAKRSDSSNEN